MSAVAIIPARGGSKRIPRKNIRTFHGRPIIAYSIDAALQSGLFARVLVSTDDEEIAAVAEACGAEAPFRRPATLADDHTGTNAVVEHALQWLESRHQLPEFCCCIYATAPFITAAHLQEAHRLLLSSGRDFAFAVTSYAFPIQRALRLLGDGSVEPLQPEHTGTRSQDLPEVVHDAGQFYWGRSTAFRARLPEYSAHSVVLPLPRHLVQDIDTPEDWRRAELMYAALQDERS